PFSAVSGYYTECLAANTKATRFLADEFGMSLETAAKFQAGFSDRSLGKIVPSRDCELGRHLREILRDVGILKRTGHETLRGCITFPLFTGNKITGIFGRRVDRNAKDEQGITIGEGELRAPITNDEESAASAESNANEANMPEADQSHSTSDDGSAITPGETKADDDLSIEESQITFVRDDRRYRIRGFEKNTNAYTLKVNIMASRDDLVHLDTLDLVKARSRASFIKATSAELFVDTDLIKRDVGQLLLKLETLREQRIAEAKTVRQTTVELSDQEIDEAMQLLRDPNLLERIVADIDACGMVGESTNKLAGYLAATSRKLSDPLAIVIQSSSSAGKTSLMDAILAMIPEEDQLRFSGMTCQSLFYLNSDEIKHRTLAISEDEGIAEATYALKLLQSEGELRHATVGRDNDGNMTTKQHHVEGPVQIMLTTTAMEIDEELVNRCLVLSVDESRNQTNAIQAKQREARMLDFQRSVYTAAKLRRLHRNAQRLIRPLRVYNPYASQLTFPIHKTRLRRDHQKYLTLIETIALLRQHQRKIHTGEFDGESVEYINVEPNDIAVANGLAGEVLGRSLDELSPQSRRLLMLLHEFVVKESKANGVSRHAFRFTRRDVREATQWSDTQVHRHLTRLVDLEYLVVHRGKQGRRFVYELLYQGEGHEGQPFLMGLIDPSKLKSPGTTKSLAG
ncbi:MAG: hypothetical protein MI861_25275, partial [Pirellulales bacterium]|nr:hypothetical protein [Pirellulales bacterium]